MSTQLRDTIEKVLASGAEHSISTMAGQPDGYADLSSFRCSCGQEFHPNGASRVPRLVRGRPVPSMPAVHRATALALAINGSAVQAAPVSDPMQIDALEPGSVLQTARGTMAQRSETGGWVTQTGDLRTSKDVSVPAVVLWAPAP